MYDSTDILGYQFKIWRTEIENGFDAYDNALVIRNYYRRHGYTEHFRELIGNEGILASAGEAIRKFVEWIRKKISEIIQKIRQFFHGLKVRVCKFLGIKIKDDSIKGVGEAVKHLDVVSDKSGRQPVIINEGAGVSKSEDIKLPGNCKLNGSKFEIPWDIPQIANMANTLCLYGKHSNVTDDQYKTQLDTFKAMTSEKGGSDHNYTIARNEMQELCEKIALYSTASTIDCDTLTANLGTYNKEVEQYLTTESDPKKDAPIDAACQKLTHATDIDRYFLYKRIDDRTSLTTVHKCILRAVNQLIENKAKFSYITTRFLVVMDRVYNAGTKVVHVVVEADRGFAEDLRKFITKKFDLGDSEFKLRNIIITNQAPDTWDKDGVKDSANGVGGWSVGQSGSKGSLDAYVNYREYKKVFEDPHVTMAKVAVTIFHVIVHECTHLFDYQNNKEIDQSNVQYWFQQHEMRARQVANTFEVKKEHAEWVFGIVKRIQKLIGVA